MKHIIIPDSHAHHGDDFERFAMAGEFVLQQRPDVVINLGDMGDMESLCSYDFGKKSFEGRRYSSDVRAVRDAMDAFMGPIRKYNLRQAKNGKKQYKPRYIMLTGNHEQRIDRVIELDPKMDGTISRSDLGYEEAGWEVQPFLIPIEVDGILYSHYFVSGIMGSPISGENPAKSIIKKNMMSSTCGHTHLFDFAINSAPTGKQVYGLQAGCFFEHHCAYAASTQFQWWRGLTVCHDVNDGEYDIETISIRRLRELL
jgi:hypothetical protein